MEFLHTADWHIGFNFPQFSEEQNRLLQKGQWQTVKSIFTYAQQHKIPFIICAGDNFENEETTHKEQLTRLFALIAQYPEINIIMIAGNHDPLTPYSIYSRLEKSSFPHNLYLADMQSVFDFKEYNLQVFASSLTAKNGTENPLAWIEAPTEKEKIRIAVTHASIKIEGKYNPEDFPIEPDIAQLKKLDYCALGHWHSYFKVNDYAYYCGIPEYTQFDKKGYVLHVKIDKHGQKPEVIKIQNLNQFDWLLENVVITDQDYHSILIKLKETAGKAIIKKYIAEGYLNLLNYKKYTEMLDIISQQYFKLFIINNIALKPTDSEIKGIAGSEYLGHVINELLQIKEGHSLYPLSLEDEVSFARVIDLALLKVYDYFSKTNLDSKGA